MATSDELALLLTLGLDIDDQQWKQQFDALMKRLGIASAEEFRRMGAIGGSSYAQAVGRTLDGPAKRDLSKFIRGYIRQMNQANDRVTTDARQSGQTQVNVHRQTNQKVLNNDKQTGIDRASIFRANARLQLQQQQQNDRMVFTEQQNSQARRTALVKSGLRLASNTYEAGLRGVTGFFSRTWDFIENRQKAHQAKLNATTKQTMTQQTITVQRSMEQQATVVRLGLDKQNAVYTNAARRRLTEITANSAKETRVITDSMVKQRDATANIQSKTSTGLLGFITGRGGAGGLARLTAGLGAGLGVGAILTSGWERLKQIQDATTAMTVVLHDQKKAADLTAQILKVVQGTPFAFPQFAEAGKNLVAFGISAGKIPGILTAIGDSAAATGKGADAVGNLVDTFGKMASQGNVQLDNVWSISAAGVPALQILSNHFGVTTEAMRKMISKGTVPAGEAIDALTAGIEKGSTGIAGATKPLAGTMQALGKTASGASANLVTAVARMAAALEKPIFNAWPGIAKRLIGVLDTIAETATKLYTGRGAWKVLRDGLIGVAVGLSAVAAAKLGVQVLSLLPEVFQLLTAAPLLTGLAALTALISALVFDVPAIHDFFFGFVNGTKNWVKVGYAIDGVVTSLSPLVAMQTAIGFAGRTAKDFFLGFVTGTVNWFKVGYAIEGVETKLSPLVAMQSSLGFAARRIKDFFLAFVTGTADWFKVGFAIKGVIDNLTPIVAIQTGVGAAFRAIADGLGAFFAVIRENVTSGKALNFQKLIVDPFIFAKTMFLGEIHTFGKEVNKAFGAVWDGIFVFSTHALSVVWKNITDFIGGLFANPFQKVRFADAVGRTGLLGEMMRSALGDTNAVTQSVAKTLGETIGHIFRVGLSAVASLAGTVAHALGAVLQVGISTALRAAGSFFTSFWATLLGRMDVNFEYDRLFGVSGTTENTAARRVAGTLGRILHTAFLAVGHAVGGLFSGLFAGAGVGAGPAGNVGRTIGTAIRNGIGFALGHIVSFLGPIMATIGSFLVEKVFGAVKEMVFQIGKFISGTLFSKPILQAILTTAVTVAGAAVVIGGQLVLGVIRGIRDHQRDILSAVLQTLAYVARGITSARNPFLILGTLLIAAFAAYRVAKPIMATINQIRDNIVVAFTRATQGPQAAIEKFKELNTTIQEVDAVGKGAGSQLVGIARTVAPAVDSLRGNFVKLGDAVGLTAAGAGADTLKKMGVSAEEFSTNVQKSYLNMGGVSQTVVDNMEAGYRAMSGGAAATAADTQTAMSDVTGALGDVPGATEDVTSSIGQMSTVSSNATRGLGTVVATVTGGISGYFATTSRDVGSAAVSILGAIGSIATQLATGNWVGAALTTVSAGVGAVIGFFQRRAQDAKKAADKIKDGIKEIGQSLTDAFVQAGGTRGSARHVATLDFMLKDLKDANSGVGFLRDKFGASFPQIARYIDGGKQSIEEFRKGLVDAEIGKILRGDQEATKAWANEIKSAADKAANIVGINRVSTTGVQPIVDNAAIARANQDLRGYNITIDEYDRQLRKAGVSQEAVNAGHKVFVDSLKEDLTHSKGIQFLDELAAGHDGAAKKAKEQLIQQQYLAEAQKQDQTKTEGYNQTVEDTASAFDKAKTAVKNYILASQGISASNDDAQLSILQAVAGLKDLGGSTEDVLTKNKAFRDVTAQAGDVLTNFAKLGITNVDGLKKAYKDWIDGVLIKGLPPELKNNKGLMDQLRTATDLPDQAFEIAIQGVTDAKDGIKGVQTDANAFRDGSPYIAKLSVEEQQALTGTDLATQSALTFTQQKWLATLDADPSLARAKTDLTTAQAVAFAKGEYTAPLDADSRKFFIRVAEAHKGGLTWQQAEYIAALGGTDDQFNATVKAAGEKGFVWDHAHFEALLKANASKVPDGAVPVISDAQQRALDFAKNYNATLTANFAAKMNPEDQHLFALAAAASAAQQGHAKGGLITKPEIALIGEAGPELILPLNDPKRTQELLARYMTSATVSGSTAGPAAAPTPLGAQAKADTPAINRAVTDAATAYGSVGTEMDKASKPGLSSLRKTNSDTAAGIATSWRATSDQTVAGAATWPIRMQAAAAPGLKGQQTQVANTNRAVRDDFTLTAAATTATTARMGTNVASNAAAMGSSVTQSTRSMSQSVQLTVADMGNKMTALAAAGAERTSTAVTSRLRSTGDAITLIVRGYALSLAGGLNPLISAVGGTAIKLARGGEVPGPDVARDVVPAMLMPGEFVVSKRAVKQYGVGRMHDINRGRQRFASGGLVYPLAGQSAAGQADSWLNPRSGGRSHKGSDLFTPIGSRVIAAKAGRAVKVSATEQGLGGITVTVGGDDGWYYYYAHLSRALATVGEAITAGQLIGLSGNTGDARGTTPHLHFSIYNPKLGYEAGSIDPFPLLTGAGMAPNLATDLPKVPAVPPGALGATATAAMSFVREMAVKWADNLAPTFSAAPFAGLMSGPIDIGRVLQTIRALESGGDYRARNPHSDASGAYQFLDSTWQGLGGPGPRAYLASPADQDRIAVKNINSIISRYGAILEAIPAAWYTGSYRGHGNLGYNPGGPGNPFSVQAYVNKWLSKYASGSVFDNGGILAPGKNLVDNQTGGYEHLVPIGSRGQAMDLMPYSMNLPALNDLAAMTNEMRAHGGAHTVDNSVRSFEGPVVGELHVHSNASDPAAVGQVVGSRIDRVAHRALLRN